MPAGRRAASANIVADNLPQQQLTSVRRRRRTFNVYDALFIRLHSANHHPPHLVSCSDWTGCCELQTTAYTVRVSQLNGNGEFAQVENLGVDFNVELCINTNLYIRTRRKLHTF